MDTGLDLWHGQFLGDLKAMRTAGVSEGLCPGAGKESGQSRCMLQLLWGNAVWQVIEQRMSRSKRERWLLISLHVTVLWMLYSWSGRYIYRHVAWCALSQFKQHFCVKFMQGVNS